MKAHKINIKILSTLIAVFLILFALGCNNSKDKKDVKEISDVIKTTSDKPITKHQNENSNSELQSIEIIVKEILMTSTRYKQLTKGLNERVEKNGGLSFEVVLEKSPIRNHNNTDFSETYDFVVYENYTERRLSTARFSFNPENKQLYEYDAVSDQLEPIEFDKSLLSQLKN